MLGLSTLCVLTACTKADIETSSKVSNVEAVVEAVKPKTRTDELQTDETKAFHYMIMDDFSQEMGAFVGLKAGDSFAVAEGKINTVFKSYDGHSEPHDIAMDKSIVEANWKQVLVTQDGLMDGTVTGQQLTRCVNKRVGKGVCDTYGPLSQQHFKPSLSCGSL